MPISLRWGTVTGVRERIEGLVRLDVDGKPCIAYPRLTGDVEPGDVVLVNTQAVELGLGSGGFDVLYANLTRGLELPVVETAHVMLHPVCARPARGPVRRGGRRPARCARRPADRVPRPPQPARPRLCGAGRATRRIRPARGRSAPRVALRQPPSAQGASSRGHDDRRLAVRRRGDPVRHDRGSADARRGPGRRGRRLRRRPGHRRHRITLGARRPRRRRSRERRDGTRRIADRRSARLVPRRAPAASWVSHHTRSALALCLGSVRVAWPKGLERPHGIDVVEVDVAGWEVECGPLSLSHMGRSAAEDPWFFAAAFAAGRLAGS